MRWCSQTPAQVILHFFLRMPGAPVYHLRGDQHASAATWHAGVFLNDALMRLGLNMRERCDMITYWLESMERSPFNVIYFVDQERLARAAQLTVSPRPDVLIRICMVFK